MAESGGDGVKTITAREYLAKRQGERLREINDLRRGIQKESDAAALALYHADLVCAYAGLTEIEGMLADLEAPPPADGDD